MSEISTAHAQAAAELAALPPHPALRFALRARLLVAMLLVAGLGMMLAGAAVGAGALAAFAALLTFNAFWLRRSTTGAQAHNLAFAHASAGRIEQAGAILDVSDAVVRLRYLLRANQLLRARIALQRGDRDASITHATRAIELPLGAYVRWAQRGHIASAHAVRALAYALTGQAAEARADAALVASSEHANATTHGYALLAELTLLARAGERVRLRALLSESAMKPAVAELPPRERALYRAYRQQAYAAGLGAYREGINVDAERALEALVALPTPPAPPARAALEPAQLEQVAERASAPRASTRKHRLRAVAAALVLGSAWLYFEQPSAPSDSPSAVPGLTGTLAFLSVPLCMLVWASVVIRSRLLATRALKVAQHALAVGDDARFLSALARVSVSTLPQHRIEAAFLEARHAYPQARFEQVLEATERALQLFAQNPTLRAMHIDIVVAGCLELRACALAALGRGDEARAELAVLLRDCPGYAHRPRVEHVVDLLASVTSGDWQRAAQLARSRPTTAAVSLREEMLADLATMVDAAAADERTRVQRELEEVPALRTFIDRVAPDLVARVLQQSRIVLPHEPELLEDAEPFAAPTAKRAAVIR